MPLTDLTATAPFTKHEASIEPVRKAVDDAGTLASFEMLGESEEGRPLYGVVMGNGPRTVSLVAGAHADEPVGPETLRTLVREGLARREELAGLFERYRLIVVPHVNPDAEARNRPWMEQWPDPEAYLRHRVREQPGRDVEFGYPSMRQENRLVSAFLERHAPFVLHVSLHGMGFAEGAMLLVERHWTARTQPLRDRYVEAARGLGLGVHDHNRKGDKGFFYIEPGFWTTPEGAAMKAYFRALGDEATAQLFHDSSMEWVRSQGGDPLCLVTEVPLFVLDADPEAPCGVPVNYVRFRGQLEEVQLLVDQGETVRDELDAFGVRPVKVETASRLQLTAIAAGLEAVEEQERRLEEA